MTLEDTDYSFSADMCSVIPKNIPHHTESKGDSFSYWEWMYIDVEGFLRQIYQENPLTAERMIERINRSAHCFRMEERPEVGILIRQMMEVMRKKEELYLEEIKGILLTFLVQVARWNRTEETQKELRGSSERRSTMLTPALTFIDENLEQQIRIEELAERCHISETHFRRTFGECMRMSPLEYINRMRIKKACDELKRTNDTISAIASRTGFVTLSTFDRNFRNIMGVSPQQWRKNPEHYERKLLNYDIKKEKGW